MLAESRPGGASVDRLATLLGMVAGVASPPRVTLFGLPFVAASTVEEVAAAILADRQPAADGHVPMVVTPNVDIMVQLDRPEWADQRRQWERARWVLPDGAPIVWASALLGRRLPARLTGSSLFAALWPVAVRSGRELLVVAPDEEVVTRLRREHPALRAVVPPRFDADDGEAIDGIVERCLEPGPAGLPDLVVFGLSNHKQAPLVDRLLARWPADDPPMVLCLGASLDMYVGLERRAPAWMQRWGLEWFFRFLQDPRGKFRRYFVDDPRFVAIVWREWRQARR